MGCVQARPPAGSPPPHGLEKMKLQNGYVAAPKSSFSRDLQRRGPPRSRSVIEDGKGIGMYQVEEVKEEKENGEKAPPPRRRGLPPPSMPPIPPKSRWAVAGEERAGGGGDDYELVDGWPKWLTDNIPRDVLAGLVPRSADSYDKLDKVGQGTYSNVYRARDRETGKIVALKKVRFDTTEPESIKFMAREIMILQKLDHPNVIKLEGLATSRMHYSIYLVFDFMPADLARVISHPEERLTEPQVKCYMQQLLSGLKHCHERGILHRDIKGSNLLIDKEGMLKIADFGLANYFNPNKKRPLTSRVVTLWYRAPELLLGTTDYGVGIDLWSAGCLLAEMLSGRPIMPGKTEVEQLHRIFKLCGSPSEDYWRKLRVSTSFRPPQPYKPKIAETFKDFPSSSLSLLKIFLALDPSYRGSASSALYNEFFSTTPMACNLSGLPVIYKQEEDESILPRARRKRRSVKLAQLSRTQRGGPRNLNQDIMKQKVGDYGRPKENSGVRSTYSHELGSITTSTGSTSSDVKPQRYSASSPPSVLPIKSPSFRWISGVQATHSHELGSSTTGSTPSGLQPGRYSVSHPPSPPPVTAPSLREQRTEAHHSAAKKSMPSRAVPRASGYGMEKRSVSTSSLRRFDEKQTPKR